MRRSPTLNGKQSVIEKLKQHWFISVLLVCVAVAGTTWKVAHELLVEPREFQNSQLKEENLKLKEEIQKIKALTSANPAPLSDENPLVYLEAGVFEKASVTTNDGRCNIRVVSVSGDSVTLAVTIDSLAPVVFKNEQVGSRVTADAGDKVYYIDLHRIRGNIVDLSVYKRKKQE